jgi:ABC-type dipeptide/oligopeptide/nickel transport system permease component
MEIGVFILFAEGLITEIAAKRHIKVGETLGEFVEWAIFLGLAGLILGLLGGSASGLLALVTRRSRGQNAP